MRNQDTDSFKPSLLPLKNKASIANIPGDKSISHRAIIIGALSDNTSTFRNFLFSEDCLNTASIFSQLGVPIRLDETTRTVTVSGVGLGGLQAPSSDLDVGNSGTGIRLITGVLAAQSFQTVISGDASIEKRPMKRIVGPLSEMGASIEGRSLEGKPELFPPLTIHPVETLSSIEYELPVASAQVKSAILLASLYCEGATTIIEPEKCRDHTETMLAYFGADLQLEGKNIRCSGKSALSNPSSAPLFIPSDFSSAAFFIALGLIAQDVRFTLSGIGLNPTRSALLEVFQKMGANLQIKNLNTSQFEPFGDIEVQSSNLTNIEVPQDLIPFIIDEIPILAVVSLFAKGTLKIRNAKELRVKESDRIHTISEMIQAMGGNFKEFEDGFEIEGPCSIRPFEAQSHGDHRIAMSAIIASTAAQVEATIYNCNCIKTSFPSFFEILASLELK